MSFLAENGRWKLSQTRRSSVEPLHHDRGLHVRNIGGSPEGTEPGTLPVLARVNMVTDSQD